jgi:hypothetical protein
MTSGPVAFDLATEEDSLGPACMHVPFIAGLSHIIIVQYDIELLHALVLACGTIHFDNVPKSCPKPVC